MQISMRELHNTENPNLPDKIFNLFQTLLHKLTLITDALLSSHLQAWQVAGKQPVAPGAS